MCESRPEEVEGEEKEDKKTKERKEEDRPGKEIGD